MKSIPKRKALVQSISLASLLLCGAVAHATNPSATDPLEVQVELAPGLSFTCTELNFGEIFLELGPRSASGSVTIPTPNQLTDTLTGPFASGPGITLGQVNLPRHVKCLA